MSSPFEAKKKAARDGAAPQRALVAFSAQTDLWWLRLLRPGFRHCFAVVEVCGDEGHRWVLYNPLSCGTQLETCPLDSEEVIRAWLTSQGCLVVPTHVRTLDARLFGWRPYTCVEAVKRVLRLHAPWVVTPWRLYRWLEKTDQRKKSLTSGRD